jgi:Ser/Thr protein kinase RdoA (MazF antagonist)
MLRTIAQQFSSSVIAIEPLGNGHINDTYLVATADKPFVLQRINRLVFTKPGLIMANLAVLNRHVMQEINHQPNLRIPQIILTTDGENHYLDSQGDYWRALSYIANSQCFETLESLAQARQVGIALGQFHQLTHRLDVNALHDTLPGFHITPGYYQNYRDILAATQVIQDAFCADFIEHFADKLYELEHAKAKGLLNERVIHGDPKLNNFLFDKNTGQIISLIDLDTVKPGLIHYDIGDCLRSICHKLTDDTFDLDVCGEFLRGYLQVMHNLLTQADFEWLYPAIRLIPFELGLRFYNDYLDGDRYFKITQPEENLIRAKAQFRVCASVMSQEEDIKSIICKAFTGSGCILTSV